MSNVGAGIPNGLLYKFISLDSGLIPPWQERLDLLLDGRCYLSSAADFNDPFDCLPCIHFPTDSDATARWIGKMIDALADVVGGNLPQAFVKVQIRDRIESMNAADMLDKLQEAAFRNADAMGVFCLTECINSVLMWSHYADNHRGAALQFTIPDPERSFLPLWKVRYQSNRPVVHDVYELDPSQRLVLALATKASVWSYEREWRAMRPDHARRAIDFDQKIITGIVLGVNCGKAQESYLRNVATERKIRLYRMRADRETFEISVESA